MSFSRGCSFTAGGIGLCGVRWCGSISAVVISPRREGFARNSWLSWRTSSRESGSQAVLMRCPPVSGGCWRGCTGVAGGVWRCWLMSMTSRSWMLWVRLGQRVRTVISCAGFTGCSKPPMRICGFVLLTGVSKFSKVSLFSGLNNLEDITLNPVYSSMCGFTEADLDRVFAAELEGLDRERVREWYNGYSWLGPEKVYNPYDVLMLLRTRRFEAYWFETGSPGFLLDTLMDRGVSTVTLGDTVSTAEMLSAFDVDRIATEALLFQTGYLTIAGTEEWDDETYYKLAYPNLEVRKSLHGALLDRMADDTNLRTASVRRLRQALRDGDGDGLCSLFGSFLAGIPYQWHARGGAARYESYYASVFYSCFAALGLDIAVEDATSRGRIDMAVRTPQRIWLFEFKITGTSGAGREHPGGCGYATDVRPRIRRQIPRPRPAHPPSGHRIRPRNPQHHPQRNTHRLTFPLHPAVSEAGSDSSAAAVGVPLHPSRFGDENTDRLASVRPACQWHQQSVVARRALHALFSEVVGSVEEGGCLGSGGLSVWAVQQWGFWSIRW